MQSQPIVKDNKLNQGAQQETVKIEDAAEKQYQKSKNDKSSLKNCLKNYEALKKQYDDFLVKLSDIDFKAATYKREVYDLLRTELEKVKQEKEGLDFKIAKFDKSAKDLDQLLESQITEKSKKGFGYNAVLSPHPLILNRPTTLDLSYLDLEEFKEQRNEDTLEQHQMTKTETSSFESPLKVDKDWKEKFFYPTNHVSEVEPKKVRKKNDAPIIEDWVSDDEGEDESPVVVKKKTVIHTAAKIQKTS
ncbi:hypothetical protein Tco_0295734 [Tanacetum coccineum]